MGGHLDMQGKAAGFPGSFVVLSSESRAPRIVLGVVDTAVIKTDRSWCCLQAYTVG